MESKIKNVQVKESELVKIIDKIVTETVNSKKKQWIQEGAKRQKAVIAEQVKKMVSAKTKTKK